MRTHQHLLHRQSGIVLIVSLFILVLLTIIGVSGMKVTSLEEKMAGNDRDQSVAFQAAEAALRMGEAQVAAIDGGSTGSQHDFSNFCDNQLNSTVNQQGLFANPNILDGNCSCGTTPNDCVVQNPMNSSTWTGNNSVPVTTGLLTAGTSARYYITYHYFYRNKGADKTIDSYYFVVTARGAGAKGGEVLLRSYFGAKLDMGKI